MAKKYKCIEIIIEKDSSIKLITWTNNGKGYDDEELKNAIALIERGKNVINYKAIRR